LGSFLKFKEIAKIENLEKLNPDKQIVVYCYTGRTASQATAILNILGYDARNLLCGDDRLDNGSRDRAVWVRPCSGYQLSG